MNDLYAKLRVPGAPPDDDLCSCAGEGPIVLRSALGPNPLACARCNRELRVGEVPLQGPLLEQIAAWARFHDCFYRLWLDSGEFEGWARAELVNPQSPVNTRGLAARAELDRSRRTYYWWFRDAEPAAHCPLCRAPLVDTGLFGRVCEACSVMVAEWHPRDPC